MTINPTTERPHDLPCTQLIVEPSQADTPETVRRCPALSGPELVSSMQRSGVTIGDAARVFDIPMTEVRRRRRTGVTRGAQAWEWTRFLPDRARTLRALSDRRRWQPGPEASARGRCTLKFLEVRAGVFKTTAIAVELTAADERERVLLFHAGIESDSVVLFGPLDPEGAELHTLSPNLQAGDARTTSDDGLESAHRYVSENWGALSSGDCIDARRIDANGPFKRASRGLSAEDRALRDHWLERAGASSASDE